MFLTLNGCQQSKFQNKYQKTYAVRENGTKEHFYYWRSNLKESVNPTVFYVISPEGRTVYFWQPHKIFETRNGELVEILINGKHRKIKHHYVEVINGLSVITRN